MTRFRLICVFMATVLLWRATDATLLACPICFRMDEGPVSDGVRAAVIVLMTVTVAVLGCFGAFVVRLARTENRERGTANGERRTGNAERGTEPA
jgi:hypothetical protein